MIYDLIEHLFDHAAKRRGWAWQRYVIMPFLAMAAFAALLGLDFLTSGWWLPALPGLK